MHIHPLQLIKQSVRTRLRACAAAAVAAAALCPLPARGEILPPAGTVATAGTTAAARPELDGTVVEDRTAAFSQSFGGAVVSGTLTHRVLRESAAGTLDFYYQVTLDPGSAPLSGLRMVGFTGLSTDVGGRLDLSGEGSFASAARSADGRAVEFTLAPGGVPAGATSPFVFVKTDATAYDAHGDTAVLAGDLRTVTATFEPVLSPAPPSAVPLPPAAYTGIAGLCAAAFAARRRWKAAVRDEA